MLNIRILKVFLFVVGLSMVFQFPVCGTTKGNLPRFSATFDFDPSSFEKGEYGFRVHAVGNRLLRESVKNRSSINSFYFSYGVGFGSYRTNDDVDLAWDKRFIHQAFLLALFDYRNKTIFEPFVGVYPGYAWEARKGFFFNPVAGSNIKLFNIDRNWNSKILTLFFQIRGEYNTLLSSFYTGGGFIFQFF
ncbi:MAG: hypothetical protein LBS03_11380 [Bacteroidales bacterium]|jgi:hypothetical protein|nr:hypothetical protein [Bacteroidales bacterium]